MKICHIATGFPLSFQGGITNYVRSLADYQQSKGHDVWVLGGNDEATYKYNVKYYKSTKIVPMKLRPLVDKEGLSQIEEFLSKEQFDILHIHMTLDIDWDLYEILKKYKYVVSLHDYFFLCPRIQMLKHDNSLCTSYNEAKCSKCISWFNTKRIFNGLEYKISHDLKFSKFRLPEIPQTMTKERYNRFKQLLENAKVLLPVSKRVEEIFRDSGISGDYRVMHIGNITADTFKDEFQFDENKECIDLSMLGSMSYLKGGELLIKLAQNINRDKIKIHFYGRSGSYAERFKEVGIFDHGPYKQDELASILNDIDIGMVLSVWEDNGPQVVMEFLNNHIPVIGTRMGGIPDFVNDSNGFLFNPYSDSEFKELIQKVNNITRKDIYEMKKNIRPTMTTKEHSESVLELYSEILNA